jgi:hypothetical protein
LQLFDCCSVTLGFFVHSVDPKNVDRKYTLVYIALLSFEVGFTYFVNNRDVEKDPDKLTFLFEGEKQNFEALTTSTLSIYDGICIRPTHSWPRSEEVLCCRGVRTAHMQEELKD